MPNAASLRNLRPWKPGQSGNPKGRPRSPRFTEREQHAMLAALAGALGDSAQRDAIKAIRVALTNPRTVLKALETGNFFRLGAGASALAVVDPCFCLSVHRLQLLWRTERIDWRKYTVLRILLA